MVETFGEQYATSRAKKSVWEGELLTSQEERMGRRVAKKHRVKWTVRQELYEISYGGGHFWFKKWSKL